MPPVFEDIVGYNGACGHLARKYIVICLNYCLFDLPQDMLISAPDIR